MVLAGKSVCISKWGPITCLIMSNAVICDTLCDIALRKGMNSMEFELKIISFAFQMPYILFSYYISKIFQKEPI